MASQWWYVLNGAKAGPVDESTLINLYRQQAITADTLAWTAGQANWAPLHTLVLLPVIPPPVPPQGPPPVPGRATFTPAAAGQAMAAGSAAAQDLSAAGMPRASAWRRFFARLIDGIIFGYGTFGLWMAVMVAAGAVSTSPSPEDGAGYWFYIFVVSPVMTTVMEWVWWSIFQQTPGKAILGVYVLDHQGHRPGGADYGVRLANFYLRGIWLNIPLLGLIAVFLQFRRVRKGLSTSYDEGRWQVLFHPQARLGWSIAKAIGIWLALLTVSIVVLAIVSG